ncbi:MAG: hypothetical protein AB7I98_21315 [Verrucomicrobiales bacterium]
MPKSFNPYLGGKLAEYSDLNKVFDPARPTFYVVAPNPFPYLLLRKKDSLNGFSIFLQNFLSRTVLMKIHFVSRATKKEAALLGFHYAS